MLPSIILDKIYWYLWKYKQKAICSEYNIYFSFGIYENCLIYDNIDNVTYINKRFLNPPKQAVCTDIAHIHNFLSQKFSEIRLPKYYFYSNANFTYYYT